MSDGEITRPVKIQTLLIRPFHGRQKRQLDISKSRDPFRLHVNHWHTNLYASQLARSQLKSELDMRLEPVRRRRWINRLLLGAVALIFILSNQREGLCTNFVWSNPDSGDWSTKSNWSPSTNAPPSYSDTATINSSAPLTVATNTYSVNVASLSVPDSTTTLSLHGALQISTSFTTSATINLVGRLSRTSPVFGQLSAPNLALQGIVNVGAGSEINSTQGTILNTGTINFLAPVNHQTGGDYFSHIVAAAFTNQGAVHIFGNQLSIEFSPWFNQATVQVDAGATIYGSKFTNEVNGYLSGGGVFISGVDSHGLISPGDDISGVLTLTSAFQQFSDGMLRIDVSGRTVGTEYDQLAVTSTTAQLDGALQVAFHDGFVPLSTDTFTIIRGFYHGTFNNTPGNHLSTSQGTFDVVYGNGSVVLTGFVAVPEPASGILAGFGLIGLLACAWCNRGNAI